MTAHDDAPLTSRSGGAQMHERPASFSRAGEASERPMQNLQEPVSTGKPPSSGLPLLFRVWNAITGSKEQPATHNMPRDERFVYAAMANRAGRDEVYKWGVALLEADCDLGASTVRKCIAALVQRRWIRDLGMVGPANRSVRAFQILESGDPWPARDKRRETPTERRGRLGLPSPGAPRDGNPALPRETGQHATGTRPPTVREPGLPPHGDKPLSDPLQEPLKEPHPIAPARGAKGVGKGNGQTAIAFEPVEPKVKAVDGYAQAWVDGNADARVRVSRPTASQVASLGRAAAAHARYRDGEPITGAELQRWIRVKSRKFRETVEDPDKQRGGMTPYGLLLWLDDDPDTRAKPWPRPEEREAARQPPPPEPLPVYTQIDQERAIMFQRRLMGLPDLAPEELTAAARRALAARPSEVAHG